MENGKLLTKSLSKAFPNKATAAITESLALFLLGAIAIVLHAKLRIPMHLPGKQGVLFMMIIVMSASMSRFSFATSLTCLGASAMLLLPFLGFDDPFMPLVYLLLGICMDLIFGITGKSGNGVWIKALAGAFCWMMIPVIRMVFEMITGYQYLSLAGGMAWPLMTHFFFGFAGSLLGASLGKYANNKA